MKHAEEGDDAASLDYGLTTIGRREINIEAAVSRCSGMPEYVFVHPEDHISDADVYRGRTEFHLVNDNDMRFGRRRNRSRCPDRYDRSHCGRCGDCDRRSEEHTSELQSLMRISYAVFCLKKKNKKQEDKHVHSNNTKIAKNQRTNK